MSIQEKYNAVQAKAEEELENVSNGQGYSGILAAINMAGAPTLDNLEFAFEVKYDNDLEGEVTDLYNRFCK